MIFAVSRELIDELLCVDTSMHINNNNDTELKRINHNLNETVDKLIKDNDQLITNANTLLNEKEEQYKQLNEVSERLNSQTILNEQLSRKLNKYEQRFVKLEMDFQEEKLTNKQLVENV
ncbi:unnamed protein product [Adineta steineri]|uniref:Uncharacterized protein n=1 Tax=Adineta steineri TaxID=433720 RepID=A0A816BPM6_9BILA|nr:unnamed protein product [Adineta steineri]CAF1613464.1 unnamed protein product [Adineta steineri]